MSGWIDTHCHITDAAFTADRLLALNRCREQDVARVVTLGIDIATSFLARNLARLHPSVYFCAGVHPHDVDRENAEDRKQELMRLWSDPKCVAIGEIGMDNFRDYSSPIAQERSFRWQLRMATEIGKPVVIHNRSAGMEILRILEEENFTNGGIFHCFSEDAEYAGKVIALGFYVSFAGNVTYENSPLLAVAKAIPTERILIETDSPWLVPKPFPKRDRNEPSYVAHTGLFLANALGIEPAVLQQQLFENTITCFRMK
ncbi:MAG: TatD family hydrolase [bacterium]|nr:TatD family hydrolase [bacterium]